MIALQGAQFLGGVVRVGSGPGFRAIAAATGEELAPEFRDATDDEVDTAVAAVAGAAPAYAATSSAARAAFLRRIADELLAAGDELLERAHAETALPRARLEAERGRTVFQLRTFADLVAEGSWVDARIDRGDPAQRPQPRPDLRTMLVPLGPVAVFGASNFPFAYSVAGGDTASALAVGCPVVVKAHPAHPGTSELTARAVVAAARATGMPTGVFAMVHGRSHDVGRALVQHALVAACGFTGSAAGGRALCALAAARRSPIPVFAEMGSANPVFVLPAAMAERGVAIAQRLAQSALLATGQFCTSPGIVLFTPGPGADAFVAALTQAFAAAPPGTLVHPSIQGNFARAVDEVRAIGGVRRDALGAGAPVCSATGAAPMLFAADAATVLAHARLREEVYGPAVLLVACRSRTELRDVAAALDGHLTATVHGTTKDLEGHGDLLAVLRTRVGRLIYDGVPTGVEVATAMQHGGPWPASSDARFTAVGPRAVLRWVRPLCLQDAPAGVVPPALQDGNPLGIWRTVDGVLSRH